MNTFEWLKFIHVLVAVIWVGGGTFLMIMAHRAKRGPLAHKIAMTKNADLAGRIFMVSGIIVLAMGIWMVIDTEIYEFSQLWILIGIVGLVISALIGALFFGPQGQTLIAEYEAGSEAAGDKRLARIANVAVLDIFLLYVIVWAMVAKPGL